MDEQDSMCDQARKIAVQAGVLEQCEVHEEFFAGSEEIEEAFKLAETMALSEGFEAGESMQQLSKRIEGYFTENAKYRSEMISRKEVVAPLSFRYSSTRSWSSLIDWFLFISLHLEKVR